MVTDRVRRRGTVAAVIDELSDDEYDELIGSDADSDSDEPKGKEAAAYLKGALKEPRFKTLNLRQLHDLIHLGNVDLDPSYQRDVVWPESKMGGLIQSLFLNYYVPPIIFAVQEHENTGEEVRVCIDGKQRCTSVQKFIEGTIPYKTPDGKKFYYTQAAGRKGGKPLPTFLKRRFDNISLQVVEYDDISEAKQRDIFQRVQLGVALSTAEKLQARPGPWSNWFTELQKKYITGPDTLGSLLPSFDTKRARGFQNIASFVLMAYEDNGTNTVDPSSHKIGRFLEREDKPEKHFARKIEMALSIMLDIATLQYDKAFGTVENRVAPVEFFFIALLIYRHMDNMTMRRLAMEISKMRLTVRKKLVDIRSNTLTMKSFYQYLKGVPTNACPNERSAAEEYDEANSTYVDDRARKGHRREEEEDASYYDNSGLIKSKSDVVGGLRSKKAKVARVEGRSANAAYAQAAPVTHAVPQPGYQQLSNLPPNSYQAPSAQGPYGGPPAYSDAMIQNMAFGNHGHSYGH